MALDRVAVQHQHIRQPGLRIEQTRCRAVAARDAQRIGDRRAVGALHRGERRREVARGLDVGKVRRRAVDAVGRRRQEALVNRQRRSAAARRDRRTIVLDRQLLAEVDARGLEVAVLVRDRCRQIHNPRGQRHAFPAVRVGAERLGHCAVLGEGHDTRRRIKLDGERQRAAGSADMAFDGVAVQDQHVGLAGVRIDQARRRAVAAGDRQCVADRRTVHTLNRGERRREVA